MLSMITEQSFLLSAWVACLLAEIQILPTAVCCMTSIIMFSIQRNHHQEMSFNITWSRHFKLTTADELVMSYNQNGENALVMYRWMWNCVEKKVLIMDTKLSSCGHRVNVIVTDKFRNVWMTGPIERRKIGKNNECECARRRKTGVGCQVLKRHPCPPRIA